MAKHTINKAALIICLYALLGCATDAAKKQETASPVVSPAESLSSAECGAGDFRGLGTGASEPEALNAARSAIAQQIQSSLKASQTHTVEQAAAGGMENLSSKYAAETVIETALGNAQDARVMRVERGDGEVGAVLCMSRRDAAKGFAERLRPIAASLEFAANAAIETRHPKLKSEAWQKAKPLWNEFAPLHSIIKGLDMESADVFESAAALYAKARDGYLDFCQTAKLYWNPEKENTCSGIAFAKLSQNLKLEKADCMGNGISLIYKPEYKCELAGIFGCRHKPSLLIASCDGVEYQLLENPSVLGNSKREDVALEKLHEKLREEAFWNNWEREIKQWRPLCE